MTDLPLVSIAAVNYNNSKYIVETLDSIRNQDYPNIELIIVDDCSTDNCREIIEEWLAGYKGKFKYIRHEKNMGIPATCNSGLRNSSGKYFSMIGTDDILVPDKISKQVKILEDTDASVAGLYSDAVLMDDNGNPLPGLFIDKHRNFTERPSGRIYEVLLQGNYIPAMSCIWKRSVFDDVGEFDESLVYEDYDMWLRIARKYQVLFSDHISCRYRIHGKSASFTIKNWSLSDIKIFLKHVGAPLPWERLRDIATHVYNTRDADTLPYLREMALQTGDQYLLVAYLFGKFNVPPETGQTILPMIRHMTREEIQPRKVIQDLGDIALFTNLAIRLMPFELLKRICKDAYHRRDTHMQNVVISLAKKTADRYLKTVVLLWKMNISNPVGDIILERIDNYIFSGKNNIYIDLCIYKDLYQARRLRAD